MDRITRRLVAVMFSAVIAAVPASSGVGRADVQVSYTVNHKALKAVVSSSKLTFTLYSDSDCTTQLGSPINTSIDMVALIERLRRFTPKGVTKPPATDRLTTVLAGVTPEGAVFLTVTGNGIAPVGGECQFQFVAGTMLPCASQVGTDVFFTGCNVNVRNGSGNTAGPVNGLGNLIVGYNSGTHGQTRIGSHNLVVGDEHEYTSFGGFVVGANNRITGEFASIGGGIENTASGDWASVSGGTANTASGTASSVSGGVKNIASGEQASVSGGGYNTASGGCGASVSGGYSNTASGVSSSVSGGVANTAGDTSSVSGGKCNFAGEGPPPACSSPFSSAASVSGGQSLSAAGFEWHAGQSAGFPAGTEY